MSETPIRISWRLVRTRGVILHATVAGFKTWPAMCSAHPQAEWVEPGEPDPTYIEPQRCVECAAFLTAELKTGTVL